jgi:hypothetical protein
MGRKKIISELYVCFNWAFLTLGASELILVLINPLCFLLITVICAIVFMVYLNYVHFDRKSNKRIVRLLTFCGVFLIVLKWIYNYSVLLDSPSEIWIINILSIITFLITGFISGLILLKFSNVA